MNEQRIQQTGKAMTGIGAGILGAFIFVPLIVIGLMVIVAVFATW